MRGPSMREVVLTLLDAVGLLLVAAGVAASVFPVWGWACLVAAGVVVLAGSVAASFMAPRGPRRPGDVR